MRPFTARQIAHVMGAQRSTGAPETGFAAVFTDSRHPIAGGLFVALEGPRFDGHAFVAQAVAGGAAGVVVSRDVDAGDAVVVRVKDTEVALADLARAVRNAHPGRFVGVTGSVGKTTMKDMIAAALSAFGPTAKTPGNLNNHLGVPLALAGTRGDEAFVVLEMGMSAPGEIARLAELVRPEVGVVTCAEAAHLAFFADVDGIADAKAELWEHLPADGRAVVNVDDARLLARARALRPHGLVGYGHDGAADVRLVAATQDADGVTARIATADGHSLVCKLSCLGLHNAHNAAGALAACVALGVTQLERAADALSEGWRPAKHRLELVRLTGGGVVVDDAYNASPVSTGAALDAFAAAVPAGARRGIVLGTMHELGFEAELLHRQIGAQAARLAPAFLAATGPHAADIAEGAPASGQRAVVVAADASELVGPIGEFMAAGDAWLLLKGSRAERLERLRSALEGTSSKGGA